jgi:hypothetical protein
MAPPKPPLGLTRKLRDDIYAITSGQPNKWVTVGELSLRHPNMSIIALDVALALALDGGWMEVAGNPPESVRLTYDGRRLASGGRGA